MNESMNPEIPIRLQKKVEEDKEQAFTLYLDFVVDATASMYTVFPAVYYSVLHVLEALSSYEVYPRIGLTLIRDEKSGEETEIVDFEKEGLFTDDSAAFLKKLRSIKLYGGGEDGRESVHTAIARSLSKFPGSGRNKAVIIFTDAFESNDMADYSKYPMGQVVIFCTEDLCEEDFGFCFVREDGSFDEEGSPMFISFEKILKPMSTDFIDNIVKPLKDLMKGVSIGA